MRYSLRLACVLAAALAVAALLPLSPAQAGPPASGGGDVAERLAEMTRSIEIDGETLDFTTRAGTLVVRNDEGEPVAELFYVAHELDGTDRDRRPLTFIWDGGPGGSTMLMDVLGYGPLRHAPATNPKARAPFRADPNPHTLLRQSDLVFIDLIGTGYSRAVGRARNSDFWGVGPDADVTAKAIERYLKLTHRWQSPKFLLGNSYGTTRAAVVSRRLQGMGIALNGVVLVASALNFGAFSNGMDHQFVVNLPTMAAVAWHHGKTAHQEAPLDRFLDEVEAFAGGDYAQALFAGNALDAERRREIAEKLSGYIGLDRDYIERAHLRVSVVRFRKELLRGEGKVVGRLDGREVSSDFDHAGEEPETDHTIGAKLYVPATTIMQDTLAKLGYREDARYVVGNPQATALWKWEHPVPDTAGISRREIEDNNVFPQNTWAAADLGAAMRADPHLKVMQIHGYFDFATPYWMGDYDLSRMTFDDALRSNIVVRYYATGHAPYADDQTLPHMARDLAAFYEAATAQ